VKKLIIAFFAVAALVSLPACTTSNDGHSTATVYHPAPATGPDTSVVPIIFDPGLGANQ
jgi:hypothetical protein